MFKLLRTIKRLKNPHDLWLFLNILYMLAFLPRKIRRLSIPDLMVSIDPGVAPVQPDEIKLEKTAGFIDSLLKYRIFHRYGKCLLRSLVLFRFLRRQGWPVEIHFGVRRTDEEGKSTSDERVDRCNITGHSWLVLKGEPFLEDEQHRYRYAETYAFPS